ncbi:helix-turn-helix transcriptional regulator [Puia dinghuensis]|uniref:helix-turn-helix transcriptional regulator n=1 Tax=Puia dinghuensis TaxID=1792502 RepID=UPI001667BC57|nr:helix-turn-helix transcriptional regulator [Puia dinghuensis]
MNTLLRFSSLPADPSAPGLLVLGNTIFARHKVENKPAKKNIFLTEHLLVFVVQGTKFLHLPGQAVTVAPSSVVLLKRGIYAMAEFIEEGLLFESMMVFLPAGVIRQFVLGQRWHRPDTAANCPCVVIPSNELLDSFKTQYLHYFGKSFPGLDQLLTGKLHELLLLLLATSQREAVRSFLLSAIDEEPADLELIVRNYLFQPITLAELASLSNRSLATFKRDFQRHYGASPRQWINRQRLAHAQLLLEQTDQKVSDIAIACGFESVSHFIRIFRAAFGATPQSLRAEKAMH